MKRNPSAKKLSLQRITIATLGEPELRNVAGGMPKGDHTGSVCGTACCDTDQFTNCVSRVDICW